MAGLRIFGSDWCPWYGYAAPGDYWYACHDLVLEWRAPKMMGLGKGNSTPFKDGIFFLVSIR